MALVGVPGVVVHRPEEVEAALQKACGDPEIGIVLLTDKLSQSCRETVLRYKLGCSRPLLVTMPDRHSGCLLYTSITPHIAWATRESLDRLAAIVTDNFRSYLAGQPQNLVT